MWIKSFFTLVFALVSLPALAADCIVYDYRCIPELTTLEVRKIPADICPENLSSQSTYVVREGDDVRERHCLIGGKDFKVLIKPSEVFKMDSMDTSCLGKPESIDVEVWRGDQFIHATSLDVFCDEQTDISIMRLKSTKEGQTELNFYSEKYQERVTK